MALAVLALYAVVESWGWVRAWWIYPGLSEEQRVEHFNAAFVARPWRGIAARLDGGGMTILARSDVADIGTSRCTRESECTETLFRTRRAAIGCPYVSVRFSCAYAIKTTDGSAATAFLKVSSNRNYSAGVTVPGSPAPFEVGEPRFSDADEGLCKLGFGCRPATGAHAGDSSRKETQPPALPPPAKAECKGIRAEVVGIGAACLDPGDPARRDFRDCNNAFCGPAMVALPGGRGLRGSSAADIVRLRKDDPRAGPEIFRAETPQREVTIGYRFAVGKFEVTYDEWDACLADGGCKRRPEDPRDRGRERAALPVVHVSWIEVSNEFLPWLNRKLGLSGASAYRLLTESEWEYAARAGTSTKFAFGDIISTAQANFYGEQSREVGSIAPNGFGLHDMHGNVPEWVQDCYENGYDNAPVDGSAYERSNCSSRMHRGGAWNDVPRYIRSAHRGYSDPKDRNWKGFRVARTLAVR